MTSTAHLLWVVLAVVLLIAIGLILMLVRRRNLRSKYGLLWVAVGVALVPLAVFPGFVDWAARKVGVYYQPTVIMLSAIGLLILLAMHYSWELSRLEERSRTLAEEVALLRAEGDEMRSRLDAIDALDPLDPLDGDPSPPFSGHFDGRDASK